MQKRMLLFLNTLLIIFYNIACLSHNQHRGVLRVGTTGDYPPITDYNPHTGQFNGAAIEQAKKLASYLGLQAKFVGEPGQIWNKEQSKTKTCHGYSLFQI